MIEIKDRVPTKPNRVKLTSEEDGTVKYYTLSRADEPTVDGTPINKELFDSIQNDIDNLNKNGKPNLIINGDFKINKVELKSSNAVYLSGCGLIGNAIN